MSCNETVIMEEAHNTMLRKINLTLRNSDPMILSAKSRHKAAKSVFLEVRTVLLLEGEKEEGGAGDSGTLVMPFADLALVP